MRPGGRVIFTKNRNPYFGKYTLISALPILVNKCRCVKIGGSARLEAGDLEVGDLVVISPHEGILGEGEGERERGGVKDNSEIVTCEFFRDCSYELNLDGVRLRLEDRSCSEFVFLLEVDELAIEVSLSSVVLVSSSSSSSPTIVTLLEVECSLLLEVFLEDAKKLAYNCAGLKRTHFHHVSQL